MAPETEPKRSLGMNEPREPNSLLPPPSSLVHLDDRQHDDTRAFVEHEQQDTERCVTSFSPDQCESGSELKAKDVCGRRRGIRTAKEEKGQ